MEKKNQKKNPRIRIIPDGSNRTKFQIFPEKKAIHDEFLVKTRNTLDRYDKEMKKIQGNQNWINFTVTKYRDRKIKVFISYCSEDHKFAKKLYDFLSEIDQIDPWLDKSNLLPGQNFDLIIKKEIPSSDFVIILLSKKSLDKRGYYQKEMKLTLETLELIPEGKIFVIPARLDECEVPYSLKHIHYINLFDYKTNPYQKIVEAMLYQVEK